MRRMVTKNFHEIAQKKLKLGFMTKILNLHQQVEKIFQQDNIDAFYLNLPMDNLWTNEYYRSKDILQAHQNKLYDFNMLYTKEV